MGKLTAITAICLSAFVTLNAQTVRNVGATQTYTTITAAITAASAGDTINIVDAVHTEENINVNKHLIIRGQGANQTIVQAAAVQPSTGDHQVFVIATGIVATIEKMTIRNGFSANNNGGGIQNNGLLTLASCHITTNRSNRSSGGGGGLYGHTGSNSTVSNCTFSGNYAKDFAGAVFTLGAMSFQNCTFSGNSAGTSGGAFDTHNSASSVTFTNCTFANNSSPDGDNFEVDNVSFTPAVVFKNSIIYSSGSENCAGDSLKYSSAGYNIESGSDCHCNAATDHRFTNPLLYALSDNGGPTPTMAIQSGSTAIDNGTSSGAPALDQRGYSRSSAVDIGAFEYGGLLPVRLASFTARMHDNTVFLQWSTLTEIDNSGFEIEEFAGIEWRAIGFVPGFGTTFSPKQYSFKAPVRYIAGHLLYRLKQIDRNGTFSYSGVKEIHSPVSVSKLRLAGIYPHPVAAEASVNYSVAQPVPVAIDVYNQHGQRVFQTVRQLMQSGSYVDTFSAEHLPSGIYFLVISDGNDSITQPIHVQH